MDNENTPKTNLQDEINKQIGGIGVEQNQNTATPSNSEVITNTGSTQNPVPIVSKELEKETLEPENVPPVVAESTPPPIPETPNVSAPVSNTESIPNVITPNNSFVRNSRPPIIPRHPEPPVIQPVQNQNPQTLNTPIQNQQEVPVQEMQKEMTPADQYQISTVRTYKADLNQTVQGDKITTAKVLMAEQKKREKEENIKSKDSIENPKNKFKLAASVTLIGLAIVAVLYGTFMFLTPKPDINPNNIVNPEPGLIAIDENQYIDITNRLRGDILEDVETFKNFGFPEKSIKELVIFRKEIVDGQEVSKRLPIESLFILLEFNPPFVFTRTLTDDYIFGAYRINSENKKFLLIKLDDFENAYDSLFDYEDDLVSDMRKIVGGFDEFDLIDDLRGRKNDLQRAAESQINEDKAATTTKDVASDSTSDNDEATKNPDGDSEAEAPKDPIELIDEEIAAAQQKIGAYQNFIDIVLQNSDSRAILGENSEILFYYTFIDREWVLFADDTEVLKEIKRRIREQNLVR